MLMYVAVSRYPPYGVIGIDKVPLAVVSRVVRGMNTGEPDA